MYWKYLDIFFTLLPIITNKKTYNMIARILISTFLILVSFFQVIGQSVIYVKHDATGTNDGTSWANAYTDLKSALQDPLVDVEIWIAQGTYKPTTTTNRNISFEITGPRKLYGGFDGTESSKEERDWLEYPTILSGNIGAAGSIADNSYNVVSALEVSSDMVLDGLIIRDGNYDDLEKQLGGAGLLMTGDLSVAVAKPTIRNCRFVDNRTEFIGAGVGAISADTSAEIGAISPTFINCVFERNSFKGVSSGGGAFGRKGSGIQNDTMLFSDCTFSDNFSDVTGTSCIYFEQSVKTYLKVTNCLIERDSSDGINGVQHPSDQKANQDIAIILDSVTYNKCHGKTVLFWGGSAADTGEGSVRVFIDNCVVKNNNYHNHLYLIGPGSNKATAVELKVRNSKFHFNSPVTDGPVISVFGRNLLCDIENCEFIFLNSPGDVYRTLSSSPESADSVSYADVRFSNCLFSNCKKAISVRTNKKTYSNTDFINCTFINSKNKVFEKSYFPEWENGTSGYYNIMSIDNCIIQEPPANNKYIFSNSLQNQASGGQMYTLKNSMITLTPNELAAYTGIQADTNVLYNVDPEFVDPSALDFRLQNCSPLINRGNNSSVINNNIETDLDGLPRIFADTVDLGAYERQIICNVSTDDGAEYKAHFNVQPNPAHGYIQLVGLPEGKTLQVQVINTVGQTCLRTNSNQLRIDVRSLVSGVYYVQVADEYGRGLGAQKVVLVE
jgi:hypothetical protein